MKNLELQVRLETYKTIILEILEEWYFSLDDAFRNGEGISKKEYNKEIKTRDKLYQIVSNSLKNTETDSLE